MSRRDILIQYRLSWRAVWTDSFVRQQIFFSRRINSTIPKWLTGIWTRVPLLNAETVNFGKMGHSLLFLVASGPRCSGRVLSIQLLNGWSKSMIGIGSNNWASCWKSILLEWTDRSWLTLFEMAGPCKLSIRIRISSKCSSCCCCSIQFCCGWLNVPIDWLWFQCWTNVLKPLPDDPDTDSGRKASGSLNKSAILWLIRVARWRILNWLDLWSNAFLLFIISGAWAFVLSRTLFGHPILFLVVFYSLDYSTPPTW